MSDLAIWLERIEASHPVKWDLGLDRVSKVAASLDVLAPATLTFLIAGTNGKGSTCAILSKYLEAMGLKTGLATSPHLIRFNERICINSQPVSDEKIVQAFEKIEEHKGETSLTYFEYATLATLLIFKQEKVDACVLEIGLGGRLDAMNIVDPDVSIVTRIALDHQSWLGDTLNEIAIEKAGIFRSGKPALIGAEEVPCNLYLEAEKKGARVIAREKDFFVKEEADHWNFKGLNNSGDHISYSKLPFDNLSVESHGLAIQALLSAGIQPTEKILRESRVQLPGRFQVINTDPLTILDTCHNPDAARYLVERIRQLKISGKLAVVMGVYKDKDFEAMIEVLNQVADSWYFTDLADERAESAINLEICLRKRSELEARCYDKVKLAYGQAVKQSGSGDCILVCGSFLTVAAVMEELGSEEER